MQAREMSCKWKRCKKGQGVRREVVFGEGSARQKGVETDMHASV